MLSQSSRLNSFVFIEAGQFYQNLADNVESLTVRHALLKIATVFVSMAEKVDVSERSRDQYKVLRPTIDGWNNQLHQSKVGNTSKPEMSLLAQRYDVEAEHLAHLRRAFQKSQEDNERRLIADLIANYFELTDILKKLVVKSGVRSYA